MKWRPTEPEETDVGLLVSKMGPQAFDGERWGAKVGVDLDYVVVRMGASRPCGPNHCPPPYEQAPKGLHYGGWAPFSFIGRPPQDHDGMAGRYGPLRAHHIHLSKAGHSINSKKENKIHIRRK